MGKMIVRGVERHGRRAAYHRSGRWAIKNRTKTAKATAATGLKTKTVGGAQNGGTRVIAHKGPRLYSTEDSMKKLPHLKKARKAKLRASITPGTILIILSGKYQGKRVVFLKQLDSGLLLVTGPFKINGVPLRRVAQSYVIATSASVDVSNVNIPEEVNDAFFTKPKTKKSKKSADAFFAGNDEAGSSGPSDERKQLQRDVDEAVLASVTGTDQMKAYLRARFRLSAGEYPHLMKF